MPIFKPKLVVAGTYAQYELYLAETGQTKKQARYVASWQDFAMIEASEIVKYGTWWDNPLAKSPDDWLRLELRVRGDNYED